MVLYSYMLSLSRSQSPWISTSLSLFLSLSPPSGVSCGNLSYQNDVWPNFLQTKNALLGNWCITLNIERSDNIKIGSLEDATGVSFTFCALRQFHSFILLSGAFSAWQAGLLEYRPGLPGSQAPFLTTCTFLSCGFVSQDPECNTAAVPPSAVAGSIHDRRSGQPPAMNQTTVPESTRPPPGTAEAVRLENTQTPPPSSADEDIIQNGR